MSSLLEQASLVLVPSGYKEGKVYSEITTNDNGDLTFTRASDASRTNASGLIQRVPWNLLQRSETFENAVWSKVSTTVVANAQTAPNGTTTADTMTVPDSTTVLSQAVSYGSGEYTFSVYVKVISQTTGGVMRLQGNVDGANVSMNFTPTTEWQLYTATFNATTSITSLRIRGLVFVGTLAIWGAQLVEGTTAQTYFPTTDRLNVPRLDYSQGSCPAVLLEPQRTNLALSSDDLTNATYWTINSTRFTSATTTSILGANNAFIFTEAVALDSHNVFAASTNRPVSTSGATYTISAYFKQGTRRYAGISVGSGGNGIHIFLDTTTWAITDAKRFGTNTNWVYLSSQITSAPNSGGWYRLSVTFRTDASLTLIPSIFASNVSTSTSGEPVYLGDGSTIICGQIQLEAGAYPTTYIPTTSATATRVADSFSRNNIYTNGLISASGGTWFVELRGNVAYTGGITQAQLLGLGNNVVGATANNFYIACSDGTTVRIWKQVAGTITALYTTTTSTTKIAIKWNGTTADVFVNGTKQVSATSFTPTALESLRTVAVQHPYFIQQMALYPTPLTDTQCQTLTT